MVSTMLQRSVSKGGVLALLLTVLFSSSTETQAFVNPTRTGQRMGIAMDHHHQQHYGYCNDNEEQEAKQAREEEEESMSNQRRNILMMSALLLGGVNTMPANAAIDVSGLRVEGSAGNPSIVNQLKAYDGSGATRVREIQEMQSKPTLTMTSTSKEETPTNAATWAYRANPGFSPTLTRAGPFLNNYLYQDTVVGPTSSGNKLKYLNIEFQFPNDWLQLDRANGGIQYVDQRNGDKLYVLRAPIPQGTTLASLPKATMADMIFDPNGSIVTSGNSVEDYKITSAKIISDCPEGTCAIRRRFKVKYATVTGNGLRVERRGLVDAYSVGPDDAYMIMTSSNAVKFDKDGPERETVENIVDSFRVDF